MFVGSTQCVPWVGPTDRRIDIKKYALANISGHWHETIERVTRRCTAISRPQYVTPSSRSPCKQRPSAIVVWVGCVVQEPASHAPSLASHGLFIDFPYMASVVLGCSAARVAQNCRREACLTHRVRSLQTIGRGRVCWFTQLAHSETHTRAHSLAYADTGRGLCSTDEAGKNMCE